MIRLLYPLGGVVDTPTPLRFDASMAILTSFQRRPNLMPCTLSNQKTRLPFSFVAFSEVCAEKWDFGKSKEDSQ